MTYDQIFDCLDEAAGRPSSGIVRDVLPTLAAALDARLNPKTEVEQRIITADETR
jgi:hypothetical protein